MSIRKVPSALGFVMQSPRKAEEPDVGQKETEGRHAQRGAVISTRRDKEVEEEGNKWHVGQMEKPGHALSGVDVTVATTACGSHLGAC